MKTLEEKLKSAKRNALVSDMFLGGSGGGCLVSAMANHYIAALGFGVVAGISAVAFAYNFHKENSYKKAIYPENFHIEQQYIKEGKA